MENVELFLLGTEAKWYRSFSAFLTVPPGTQSLQLSLTSPLTIQQPAEYPLELPFEKQVKLTVYGTTKIDFQEEGLLYLQIQPAAPLVAISFTSSKYFKYIRELINTRVQALQSNCGEEKILLSEGQQLLGGSMQPTFDEYLWMDVEDALATHSKMASFINMVRMRISIEDSSESPPTVFSAFTIIRNILLRSTKTVIKLLIEDQFFETILLVLSRGNVRVKIPLDYLGEFKKITLRNVLQLKCKPLLELYQSNLKIQFLKDSALCFFLEPNLQMLLVSLLKENNVRILQTITQDTKVLQSMGDLRDELFIDIFSELWGLFDQTEVSAETLNIKKAFYDANIKHKLHVGVLIAVHRLLNRAPSNPEQPFQNDKYFAAWLKNYHQVFLFNCTYAQEFVLQIAAQEYSLFTLLTRLFKVTDYHLRVSIMRFISFLIEPAENKKLTAGFLQSVFRSAILPLMYSQDELILKQTSKWYQFSPIRTRRVIIRSGILSRARLEDKHCLISVVKLLRTMLDAPQCDIYGYLQESGVLDGLREQYIRHRSKKPNCLVSSLFYSFLKDVEKYPPQAKLYLFNLFLRKQSPK